MAKSTPLRRPPSLMLSSPVLPPSLQIPAVPQGVFQHILLSIAADGVILRGVGAASGGKVHIAFGPKGKVTTGHHSEENTEGEEVEGGRGEEKVIRGVVGIVRLYSTAYLIVIVSPSGIGSFPTPANKVYTLKPSSLSAIPLTADGAAKAFAKLRTPSSTSTPQESNFPSSDVGESVAPSDEDDDDDDDDDDEAKKVRFSQSVLARDRSVPTTSTSVSTIETLPAAKRLSRGLGQMAFWKKDPSPTATSTASSATSSPPNEPVLAQTASTVTDTVTAPSRTSTPPIPDKTNSPLPLNTNRTLLESKILSSIMALLGGGQMYFSYDWDLSHSLQAKTKLNGGVDSKEGDGIAEANGALPLWRRLDRKYWWNEHLLVDFINLGLHSFVLPVLQGYVQISSFNIPSSPGLTFSESSSSAPPSQPPPPNKPASTSTDVPPSSQTAAVASLSKLATRTSSKDRSHSKNHSTSLSASSLTDAAVQVPGVTKVELILISRRSRDRAGLRYQRRGIDDEGKVANFVETEMIVRLKDPATAQFVVFSYIQLRGSIPLFWSQPATSLKPAPLLDRPLDESSVAMGMHFDEITKTYGPQICISLSETTGKESAVTNGYRDVLASLKRSDVDFVEFDFHHECKGMKFENISKLINSLSDSHTFEKQSYFCINGGRVGQQQTSSFRVNCIDCLDRTNVTESALARHVLIGQLASLGLAVPPHDPKITPSLEAGDLEMVFNDLWANNGDAISNAYAGTSALKGDFTRTGKRDWHGMLNDGLNSLARMYSSTFSDFFAQAVISFFLGQRPITIFSEFLEKLQVVEPSSIWKMNQIRAVAIENVTARVLNEGESRVAGWTLLSPVEGNTTTSSTFEEKPVILSKSALYVCSYDFQLEKVREFTRIPLKNILHLQHGPYILSALQEASVDPVENYGFIVKFNSSEDETRLSSYSVKNVPLTPSKILHSNDLSAEEDPLATSLAKTADASEVKYFAFKALPREMVRHGRGPSLTDGDSEEENDEDEILGVSCQDIVLKMVKKIRIRCSDAGSAFDVPGEDPFVFEKPVRSLLEAQKDISVMARLEYSFKRFLWL